MNRTDWLRTMIDGRRMISWTVRSIFVVGAFGSVLAIGQEIRGLPDPKAPCAGELERQHPQTPYNFTTNSQRPTDGFTYKHCIHNNQSGAIDLRWFVPTVNEMVAGNESRIAPRYSSEPPLGNRDGCLVYGNVLEKELKAEFWAREEDREALRGESVYTTCRAGLKSSTADPNNSSPSPNKSNPAKRTQIKDVGAPFRLFLAGNLNSPRDSLMAFEGVAGVRARSANSYESFVQYRVRPTEGSKASELTGYTLTPVWTTDLEVLSTSYRRGNNPSVEIMTS
jgi:hypothetical protein